MIAFNIIFLTIVTICNFVLNLLFLELIVKHFSQDMKNDDKILTTCLRLCHSSLKEEQTEGNIF